MSTAAKFGTVPTLAELLADPAKIAAVPREAIPAFRGELAQLDSILLSRLLGAGQDQVAVEDQLLDVTEAAARLGVSKDYLYAHHEEMPFTRRMGKKLLFSSRGIEKYISRRQST